MPKKKYFTDEERKAARRADAARYRAKPENKAAVQAAQDKYRAKPETIAKSEARQREYAEARRVDPEFRAKERSIKARYRSDPKNKVKERESRRAYNKTTEGIRRAIKGRWKHQGIKFASDFDRELWLALAMYDGTVCAVTGMTNAEHKAKFGKRLVLDHDHLTGEPRRFLCDDINVSLGRLERLSPTDEQLNNLISLIKEDRRQAER